MRAAAGVACGTGLAFAVLAVAVRAGWSPLLSLDADVLRPLTDFTRAHAAYRRVMHATSEATHVEWMLVYAAAAAAGLAAARRPGAALWLVLVAGSGAFLNPLLKRAVGRERPALDRPIEEFGGLSFPAGHATGSALVSGALLVVVWGLLGRRGRVAAVALAVAVPAVAGWSRLVLGGHFPTDLLGGYLLAVAWVAAWRPVLPAPNRRVAAPS